MTPLVAWKTKRACNLGVHMFSSGRWPFTFLVIMAFKQVSFPTSPTFEIPLKGILIPFCLGFSAQTKEAIVLALFSLLWPHHDHSFTLIIIFLPVSLTILQGRVSDLPKASNICPFYSQNLCCTTHNYDTNFSMTKVTPRLHNLQPYGFMAPTI